MEETGRLNPMDILLRMGEARPYLLQPQGEVEAWEGGEEEEEEEEEGGALWGEVRARSCLAVDLEAQIQRASPKAVQK